MSQEIHCWDHRRTHRSKTFKDIRIAEIYTKYASTFNLEILFSESLFISYKRIHMIFHSNFWGESKPFLSMIYISFICSL